MLGGQRVLGVTDMLFANQNRRRDFVGTALRSAAQDGEPVRIAVAFLCESSSVKTFASLGSIVRVVVRLGPPTKPEALRELLGHIQRRTSVLSVGQISPEAIYLR